MFKDNITELQHVGIPTNDIEKTKEFYQLLGFEVIYEVYNEASDEKVAFLKCHELVIETYENRQATLKTGAIDHIALTVKDIDAAFEEAKRLNFTLLNDEPQFLPFWEKGIRYFTIEGFNKEKVEFSQYL